MTDIIDRLQARMHMESAAIAPQTSETIEVMRIAQSSILHLRVTLERIKHDIEIALSVSER